ncbi:unnamed protein product [Eruca vesicaria subsp. sativa]|uniref:Uncharacterized protein n=1 Tax=Eruca vesicaria subsp. sativa TaxID=29727 RepID=A0ABC8JW36_ERUVS|nr:unnamed protein product [Eruca vesicaria subsp. sativa]
MELRSRQSEDSKIVYHSGKNQDMILVLRNLQCGEVERKYNSDGRKDEYGAN